MNGIPRTTNPERVGRWFGYALRIFVRQEIRAIRWLASKGLPAGVARSLLWIAKLTALGVLLYMAFWLVLPLVVLVAAAWVAHKVDLRDEEKDPEWRNGWEGYGLYRAGVRIDIGGTDDE